MQKSEIDILLKNFNITKKEFDSRILSTKFSHSFKYSY